jgi:MFS family permease
MGVASMAWVARIPEIKDAVGVSNGEFGFVFLGATIGAVLGAQVAGRAIHTFGSRPVINLSSFLLPAGLVAMAYSTTATELFFALMLMGFGCNVPALMGTKIMRTKELRLLTMFVIPFSLCSARLQVFLFIITALFSAKYGPLVLFGLYLLSFFTIFISALIFKHQFKNKEPIIIELPPYRFPTMNQIIKRSVLEIKHFLTRATKFIIIGVLLVWALLDHGDFDLEIW